MTGSKDNQGLQCRLFDNLMLTLNKESYYYELNASYFEIYNEKIRDLL